jgi:hypothetical protein
VAKTCSARGRGEGFSEEVMFEVALVVPWLVMTGKSIAGEGKACARAGGLYVGEHIFVLGNATPCLGSSEAEQGPGHDL